MNGKNMAKPRALLIFGAPSSGKSTFAQQFSLEFKAPVIDIDKLKKKHNLTDDIVGVIIDQLTQCRQTLIIDGGIDTEEARNNFRDLLNRRGYNPTLIWVQTDISTLKARLKAKYASPSKAKSAYESAVANMEAPADIERPIVISGKHTFPAQMKTVLSSLATPKK